MGSCYCNPSGDEHTKYINWELAERERESRSVVKWLLLQTGGSGSSTIFKQIQYIFADGYSNDDALSLKEDIYAQIICQMQTYINSQHYTPSDDQVMDTNTYQNAISIIRNHRNSSVMNDEIAAAIQFVWENDKRLKDMFQPHSRWKGKPIKHRIFENTTEYFWNHIDRISASDYIPNKEDILKLRYRTTGIIEKQFKINDLSVWVFNVGGQKSERKKWLQVFHNVHMVMYVVLLAYYDVVIYEDSSTNYMVDSMNLFENICNNEYFTDTNIVLLLNGKDLFENKIKYIPITACPAFTDFVAFERKHNNMNMVCDWYCREIVSVHIDMYIPMEIKRLILMFCNNNEYEMGTSYIKHKFEALNRNPNKSITTYYTNALDTENIEIVINDIVQKFGFSMMSSDLS